MEPECHFCARCDRSSDSDFCVGVLLRWSSPLISPRLRFPGPALCLPPGAATSDLPASSRSPAGRARCRHPSRRRTSQHHGSVRPAVAAVAAVAPLCSVCSALLGKPGSGLAALESDQSHSAATFWFSLVQFESALVPVQHGGGSRRQVVAKLPRGEAGRRRPPCRQDQALAHQPAAGTTEHRVQCIFY